MNCHQYARWRSYQKTLMAYYWLSDEEGLLCRATWAELSAEIGLGKDSVKRYTAMLERAKVIRVSPILRPGKPRTVILMDHPNAADFLASEQALRLSWATGRDVEEVHKHDDYPEWDNDNYED